MINASFWASLMRMAIKTDVSTTRFFIKFYYICTIVQVYFKHR